ncbi:MAG: PAS domain S-box protein [Bacteroidia bacterium]
MQTSVNIQSDLLTPLMPPISVLNQNGDFIYHSQKAEKTLSHWNQELQPKHISDIRYPSLVAKVTDLIDQAEAIEGAIQFTLTAPGEEYHILPFVFSQHPELRDTFVLQLPEHPAAYLSRKSAIKRLIGPNSTEFSIPEAMFYNNALGLSVSGLDGKIYQVNHAFAKMVEYDPEELAGGSFYELSHPDDAPPNKELIAKLLSGENGWISFEKRYVKKGGGSMWAKLWVRVLEEEQGPYLLATIQDITEEKRISEELIQHRKQFESYYNNTLVGINVVDIHGQVINANPAFERIIGYTLEELKQLAFRELTHPDDIVPNHALRQKVINQETSSYTMTKRYIRKDGKIIWVNVTVSALPNQSGEIVELLGTVVDISEEKIATERLQQSEERYRLIAQNTIDLISLFKINEQATISFLSPSVINLLGYEAIELEEKPWIQLVHPDDRALVAEILKPNIPNKSEIRYRVITKAGKTIWIESVFVPIKSPLGDLIFVQGNSRNITDRVAAEIELDIKVAELDDANQKLKRYISSNSELEKFAYIASHDLREPLRTIIGFTQILASRYRTDLNQEANEFLDLILDASKHMHQLVQDLLQYSRVSNESMEYREISCGSLLKRIKLDLEEVLQENNGVLIVLDLPETINGHETGLYRVFLNLISNSLKFRKHETSPEIVISGKDNGDYWQFSISDNGLGIAKEYHEQIFLLFKRLHSKVDYEGSGLGLPICRKIVDRHHGNIWVESKDQIGSTFHFTLAKNLSIPFRLS